MTYPLVQFVAAPTETADVLFDFNTRGEWADGDIWPHHDGFTLGTPTYEAAPNTYGAQDGYRTVSCSLLLHGSQQEAARVMSQLARVAQRRTSWLRFQFSPVSDPMWLKTYRSPQGALEFENVTGTEDGEKYLWGLGVTFAAEPYAYGERITLGPYTIANDAVAGSNPCMVTLPDIVGDAPAPLRVEMLPDSTQNYAAPLMAVTPVPDDFTTPTVYDIGTGAFTAGTDTGAPVSNAAYSGGSYRPVTFATDDTLITRLTIATGTITRGRYAVLLRAARSDTISTFAVRANVALVVGDTVSFDRTSSPSSGYAQWLNLGVFAFPPGFADWDGNPSGAGSNLFIQVQRLSGTGQVNLDSVVLVPIELLHDEPGRQLTTILSGGLRATPQVTRWDGEEEYVQLYTSAGLVSAITPPPMKGMFPRVLPGRKNLFLLFRHAATVGLTSTDNGDAIAATTSVTLSYQPRWRWMASS